MGRSYKNQTHQTEANDKQNCKTVNESHPMIPLLPFLILYNVSCFLTTLFNTIVLFRWCACEQSQTLRSQIPISTVELASGL